MDTAMKKMLTQTMIHKKFVLNSCLKMAEHFWKIGEDGKALEILQRGSTHDNSKLFDKDEMRDLAKIEDGYASMKDAKKLLPEEQQKLLQRHYLNNSHYPEHWEDVSQMSEMDIVEMVCDWHANSSIYGTDLIDFVVTRQQNRFHFPEEMFKQILSYCKILVS